MKGFLHGLGKGPQAWGHDLNQLGTRVAAALGEPLPDHVEQALQRLARHYVPSRYPDAVPGSAPSAYYNRHDADEARRDAAQVLEMVNEAWKELLDAGRTGDPG